MLKKKKWIVTMKTRENIAIDFKKVAENSPLAIYLINPGGYFVYVNKMVAEISGYSREELLKMHFTKLVHPESRDFMIEQVKKRFIQQGALPSYEFKGVRKHGEERFLEGYFSLIEIEEEKFILGQVLDITDRKMMEIQLKRSEEAIKRVLENSNLGYFEVDLAGNFTYVNKAIAKIMECPREKLIGVNNRTYTSSEESKRVYKIFNGVFKKEEPATFFNWKISSTRGKEVVVETSVDLIYNEKGEKVGFRGIVRDVTEELKIKKELQEREKYYREIFEGSASPMLIIGEDMVIRDVNRAFEKFSGFNRNEVVEKKKWVEFVHKNDLSRMLEYSQKRQRGSKDIPFEYEFTFLDRWGNERDVLLIVSVLPTGDTLASMTDITERKKLEEKLRFISFHDSLTGLYNRYYFEEEFRRLKNCRCLPVALIIVDLDGLKYINDNFGHKMGDEYIKTCAGILSSCVRKSDVVARIGGDEFGIILPRSDEVAVKKVMKRIKEEIYKFNKKKERKFCVNMSMGYSVSDDKKLDKDELFREADNKMYREKQRKKSLKEYICTK